MIKKTGVIWVTWNKSEGCTHNLFPIFPFPIYKYTHITYLESSNFQKVSSTVGGGRFGTRTSVDPDTHSRSTSASVLFSSDSEAVREDGGASGLSSSSGQGTDKLFIRVSQKIDIYLFVSIIETSFKFCFIVDIIVVDCAIVNNVFRVLLLLSRFFIIDFF